MKNIKILLSSMLVILAMSSCDSLKDTYTELDANYQDPTGIQELTLTLGEDEYELLEDVEGAESIASSQQFTSAEDAKKYVPYILDFLYPHLGKGTSAAIEYQLYNPIQLNNEYYFELTDEDYLALEQEEGTLGGEYDVFKAVEYKLTEVEPLDLVSLKFVYDTGASVDTVIGKIARYNDQWLYADVPTSEDYNAMGQSFSNFSSRTTAKRNLAIFLNQKYVYASEGDLKAVVFTYTYEPSDGNRVYEDYLVIFEFDGTLWKVLPDETTESLKFSFDGQTWVPDNTIRFTLSASDFALMGNAEGGDPGTSAARYGNFDRRPTNSAYWSDEMILEGANTLLKANYPSSVEGQKYLITFAIYNGVAGTETIYVIKDASGDYIYYEE